MEKCLVRQLTGASVAGLPKAGRLYYNVNPIVGNHYNVVTMSSLSGKTFTINALDGTYFGTTAATVESEHLTTIDCAANSSVTIYVANVAGRLEITNMYDSYREMYVQGAGSSTPNIVAVDVDELGYCSTITLLKIQNSKAVGDIASISQLPLLRTIWAYNTQVYGNISSFKDNSVVTDLQLLATEVEGFITDISEMTQLTRLELPEKVTGSVADMGKMTSLITVILPGIGGSVESFVAAQIANGRSSVAYSSPINWNYILSSCTFGGNNYNEVYSFLTWDGANKITIYAGNSSIGSCPRVYAKGATAEEIAAWESAGKTVIIIS